MLLVDHEPVDTLHGRGRIHSVNKVVKPHIVSVRLDADNRVVECVETELVRLDPPAWAVAVYAVGDEVVMPISRQRGVVVGLNPEHPDLVQVKTRRDTTWYHLSAVRKR